MKLHVLGVGTPDPREERYGSAFLFELNDPDNLIMVDCGPAATYKMACLGIRPTQVKHLFFTHHHFDHNADVPCFALTRWDQLTNADDIPLSVYGPPPTSAFFNRLFGAEGAYRDDFVARIQHPCSELMHTNRGGVLPRTEPIFDVNEVTEGQVARTDAWRVTCLPVSHVDPWLQSVAYRFETENGIVVFTGDAGPCNNLDTICRGADVLVLCCAFKHSANTHPLVAEVVTGSRDCARIADESGARVVVLTHSNRAVAAPGNREAACAEIGRRFNGALFFGEEKTTVDLSKWL